MATPTEVTAVDRCNRLERKDATLQSLKLGVSSCSNAQPTLVALKASTTLKELSLASAISDAEVGVLCREYLLEGESLDRLTLDLRECSDEGVEHLAELMEKCKNLQWLSLRLNNVAEKGAARLAGALARSALLGFSIYATQLDLHDRCIGDSGAKHFAAALKSAQTLRCLCIAQNAVTDHGLEEILAELRSGNTSITALDLRSNKITKSGALQIAVYLSSNASLKQLTLDDNHEIGSEGATEIALALCNNSTLQELSLKSCSIGKKGGERFAMTLNQNQALKHLNLCGNVNIGDDAVELISRGLKKNDTLETLDLSSCGVGDSACSALADALACNATLTHLLLDKNEIGDGGALALSGTLAKNVTLTSLVLTRNRLGGKGTTSLLHSLQHNSILTTLALGTKAETKYDAGSSTSLAEILLSKNRELLKCKKMVAELQQRNRELVLERDALLKQLQSQRQ